MNNETNLPGWDKKKIQKIVTILWVATLFTKCIYTFLWYSFSREEIKVSNGSSAWMFEAIIFGVMGLICLTLGFFYAKNVASPSPFFTKIMKFGAPKNIPSGQFLLTPVFMSFGFVEAPVLWGFVHFYLFRISYIYFGFLALSLIGWILVKPNVIPKEDDSEFPSPQ